jgi:hypothetical protein
MPKEAGIAATSVPRLDLLRIYPAAAEIYFSRRCQLSIELVMWGICSLWGKPLSPQQSGREALSGLSGVPSRLPSRTAFSLFTSPPFSHTKIELVYDFLFFPM